ncbi:hypothetical protein MCHI_003988 [Candidatus Magnetoovum chiemensis]|nr:hypothetical protein MCHI_003988 [Candidatus Magnetoovum chiemensis]
MTTTNTIQEPVEQAENEKAEAIKEAIKELSTPLIDSLYEYVTFLTEKEKKHKAFVERVLAAEKEPTIKFQSAKDAFKAILDEVEN